VSSSCVQYRYNDVLIVDAIIKPLSAYVVLITDKQALLAATTVRITNGEWIDGHTN